MADWNFDLWQYFKDFHEWEKLRHAYKPISENLASLEWKAKKRVEIVPWVSSYERLDDWTYRVIIFWEILDFEIKDPSKAPKIIELTFKVLQDYRNNWFKWDFYEYESLLSRIDGENKMSLQADDSILGNVWDTTLAIPFEIKQAFWIEWDKTNWIVKKYADFLNSIKWYYKNEIVPYTEIARGWKIEKLMVNPDWTVYVEDVTPKDERPTTNEPPKPNQPTSIAYR